LPSSIYAHKVSNPRNLSAQLPYPAILEGEWLITFACPNCLRDFITLTHTEQIELEKFLAGKTYEAVSQKLVVKNTNNN
jgi:hypothetical protein